MTWEGGDDLALRTRKIDFPARGRRDNAHYYAVVLVILVDLVIIGKRTDTVGAMLAGAFIAVSCVTYDRLRDRRTLQERRRRGLPD